MTIPLAFHQFIREFCIRSILPQPYDHTQDAPYTTCAAGHGNEVYGGAKSFVDICLRGCDDDAVVKGKPRTSRYMDQALVI